MALGKYSAQVRHQLVGRLVQVAHARCPSRSLDQIEQLSSMGPDPSLS